MTQEEFDKKKTEQAEKKYHYQSHRSIALEGDTLTGGWIEDGEVADVSSFSLASEFA